MTGGMITGQKNRTSENGRSRGKGMPFLSAFKNAARLFPDNTALCFNGAAYTYRELDSLTDRLAAHLNSRGIGRGDIVSVLIRRSEYMTITALGILKSGAAYEPLDAKHPKKRICSMLKDAGASFVIVEKEYEELIYDAVSTGMKGRLYTEDIAKLPKASEPVLSEAEEKDLFVILYTSGSTGEPKGIMLTHKNIAVLLSWYLSYYEVSSDSRMGEHPSFVFDLAVLESLLPLAAGGAVYIIPEDIRTDLFELGRFFDENGITHCTMTTTLGRMFAMNIRCSSLKHLTVGGEALINVRKPEGYILHNGYGPAECTAFVTMFPVLRDYPGKVPLGKAMPDVELYITDSNGERVKEGMTGELWIAGPHVAKGYINHPELTAEVFTENPFSTDPEYAVVYHTGDLARINEDGLIEYMGRADRQIKIRGFRIEPAELEVLLESAEGIKSAVVTAFGSGENKALCAYYLSDEPVDEGLLSELILASKPSYMLPSCFIHMTELPLNVNGKIDHSRLPKPVLNTVGDGARGFATDTEEKLSGLYEEVLSAGAVGRENSFYALGGNSLSAAALLYRIYETFSVRLKLSDILENPVVYALAERIDRACGAEGEDSLIRPVSLPEARDYAVSVSQTRIYTAQGMLSGTDDTYLLSFCIEAEAGFERERVIRALMCLFERHESLRTGFVLTGNGLRQTILPKDEASVSDAVRRSEGRRIFSEDFSFERAPLFGWSLKERTISFEFHHIISDGRSNMLFASEFTKLYNGLKLPGNPLHQKEYAAYEAVLKGSPEYAGQRNAWRELSSRFTEAQELHFPFDRAFREGEERNAGHFLMEYDPGLSGEIDRFCVKRDITPFMFFLSVFSVLCMRYTQKEDLLFGTVMDGRQEAFNKDMQGMFVNTVPLFIDGDKGEPFSALLAKTKETVLFAINNQSVSLEEIASDFYEEGGFSRTSHGQLLFDVLFIMQSFDTELMDIGGKPAHLRLESTERAMYDLVFEAEKREDRYFFDIKYDNGLFTEESIGYIASHFKNLTVSCLKEEAPSISCGMLSITDEREERLLLSEFMGETVSSDSVPKGENGSETAIGFILERAVEEPDSCALVYKDISLSYGELLSCAKALSRTICSHIGADEEMIRSENRTDRRELKFAPKHTIRERIGAVAIIAERGAEMIISILGTMLSGLCYVPVSPHYPKDRLMYVLRDCEPLLVITCGYDLSEEMSGCLKEAGIPILSFNDHRLLPQRGTGTSETDTELWLPAPESPAYMIYTSGTSGEPKGVVVLHGQLAAMLKAYEDIYRLGKNDVFLEFAEFVFDMSVWEIFQILTAGGTLCMMPSELAKDPEALVRYCAEKRVSAVAFTPSYLRLLDPKDFKDIRFLDTGGEAVDRALLLSWAEGKDVVNTYGPTETTVNATAFVFSRDGRVFPNLISEKNSVPIGRPASGTRVYVLNGDRLSGIGVPGELCIAGVQVSQGYYKRPELTAEKFVKDPFFEGRMYRSGDMARFLADGNLEFLGRLDAQVKLRGFRIELQEIEASMRLVPGIKNSACVVVKNAAGEDALCGYYVEKETGKISGEELRKALEEILPSYMVPQFLISLTELPVTINGKLDRRALPKPFTALASGLRKEPEGNVENTDPVIAELCRAYSTVLGIPVSDIDADFLSLGGDSIKAIRIASLLRQRGLRLDANLILRYRTIRRTAPRAAGSEEREYREYPAVKKTPVMLLFEKTEMKEPSWYSQSVMLLLDRAADISDPGQAFKLLTDAHGMLRMQLKDGGIVIRDREEVRAPHIPVFNGLSALQREAECTKASRELSPLKGDIIKAAVFINGEERRLFITIHHYAVDEVSWDILLQDLSLILTPSAKASEALSNPAGPEASVTSDISVLLEKRRTASFGEWAKRLWEFKDREEFLPQKAYWDRVRKEIYEKALSTGKWLAEYKESNAEGKGGFPCIRKMLCAQKAEKLSLLANKRFGAGPDALLLAALVTVLREKGAPEEIALLMEGHGRGRLSPEIDVSHTMGWFTSVYPFMVQAQDTFDEQVTTIKEALLRVPGAGLGYGLLYDDQYEPGGLVFNYLGREAEKSYGAFSYAGESAGEEISPLNGIPGTITFNIRFTRDGLFAECCYDSVFSEVKVSELLNSYILKLSDIASEASFERRIYGPSDLCRGRAMELKEWRQLTEQYSPEELSAVFRLTPLQQGMFYRYMTEPESRAYYLLDRLTINEAWDSKRFKEALSLISARFDALRLRFVYRGFSEPWQLVLKENAPELIELPEADVFEAADIIGKKGLSLTEGSVIRFVRCRGEEATELLIATHHCVLDGWSFQILIRELTSCYKRLMAGESKESIRASLKRAAEVSPSFADYMGELSEDSHEVSLRRWEEYLKGVETGTAPGSFRLKRGSSVKHGEASLLLDSGLSESIKRYALRHHITPGTFFGVLWGLQLGFECDSNDIVFGETVSGRNVPLSGIENAVGMLIRTIPVRVRFDENTEITSLMKRRQEDYFAMQPYEAAAISDIGSRTGLSSSLIQTVYVFENYPVEKEDGYYSLVSLFEEVEYDLSMIVEEKEGYELKLSFNAEEYPESYIELLLKRLESLCGRISENDSLRVRDLERIAPEERDGLLSELSGVFKSYPRKTFPDMLFERVSEAPEREALILEDKSLTYGELWNAVSVLAGRLTFSGERFVAVMADRSLELVISVVGIMLSGAAYVPLDPLYPMERIEYILKDSEPEALIYFCDTENRAVKELCERLGIAVIDLTSEPINIEMIGSTNRTDGRESGLAPMQTISGHIGADKDTEALWDRTAYMIYTSGTTGEPKGVEIEHKALSDLIYTNEELFGSFHDDTALFMSNYVFDASILQIFVPLAQGGRICIMPKRMMDSPLLMLDYCRKNGISYIHGTNALLRVFDLDSLPALRVVGLGGDEADPELFRRFKEKTDLVINDYGPTEACVHAAAHIYSEGEETAVPIGRPFYNKKIYIMQGDKLCGVGQKGEICISGNLARGYHNHPELTDRVFVKNIFHNGREGYERLYRTGDQGFLRHDGVFMYGGRKDSQIKLRGFRIELMEIESRLREFAGVSGAVVLLRKDENREPFLCGYVTGTEELDISLLRQYLTEVLPYYMVPKHLIRLEAFPLNYNGKIDRKRLPVPAPEKRRAPQPPENAIEERIILLFEKILSLENVGRDESFFELGGNSLDLMRLLSELNEERLGRTDIMEHPTPESLGGLLVSLSRERVTEGSLCSEDGRTEQDVVLLKKGDKTLPTLFLIPPSGGMALCYIELIRELNHGGEIYGLIDRKYRLFGEMSLDELKSFDPQKEDMWHETIDGYLRTLKRLFKNGDILIGYSQGASAAHILSGLLEKKGKRVSRLIMLDALPEIRESGENSRITGEELLRTAEVIYFGYGRQNRVLPEAGEDTEEFIRKSLKAHGEKDDERHVHAFYETLLVYSVNVAFPLLTEGKVRAPVYSVMLTEERDSCNGDVPLRLEKDPWAELTDGGGEAYGLYGNERGHMTFLNSYRRPVASLIRHWLLREEKGNE